MNWKAIAIVALILLAVGMCHEADAATPPPKWRVHLAKHMHRPEVNTPTELRPVLRERRKEIREGWEKWRRDFLNHLEYEEALRATEILEDSETNESSIEPVFAPSPPSGNVEEVICEVFGSYCSQALSVAMCESTMNVYAVNGQYLGLFQMGANERATYGHGPDALTQSRAAYAYFAASGYDWSPWACKP